MKILQVLTKIKEWANSDRPIDILFIAVNEVSADFQIRVFNDQIGYRDIYGNAPKPTYSDPYKKVRANYNPPKQTNVVDFQLSESLRRSIKTVREQTGVKLVLSTAQEAKISAFIEQYRGTKIFELSEEENKRVSEIAIELMLKDIKAIFNEFL